MRCALCGGRGRPKIDFLPFFCYYGWSESSDFLPKVAIVKNSDSLFSAADAAPATSRSAGNTQPPPAEKPVKVRRAFAGPGWRIATGLGRFLCGPALPFVAIVGGFALARLTTIDAFEAMVIAGLVTAFGHIIAAAIRGCEALNEVERLQRELWRTVAKVHQAMRTMNQTLVNHHAGLNQHLAVTGNLFTQLNDLADRTSAASVALRVESVRMALAAKHTLTERDAPPTEEDDCAPTAVRSHELGSVMLPPPATAPSVAASAAVTLEDPVLTTQDPPADQAAVSEESQIKAIAS